MTKHRITMIFEDGRSEEIEADEADTVYMAALRNKIRLMTDCLEGACATCKGQVVFGEYLMDDYSDEAITDEEMRARKVLTCQTHAKSDCVIEFPYDSKLALKIPARSWECEILSIENVSVNVVKLDLGVRGDADAWPSFMPGQYVNIAIPEAGQNRSYSFANSPGAKEGLTFYIKILERGVMSDFLRGRAKQGDLVNIEGPFGHFYLRGQERPILMMAGGTGLAPMLSMLDQMASMETCRKPIHLLYGVNNPDEFFGIRQIESYESKGIDLTYETISLNGSADWNGNSGHVTELLTEKLIKDNPEIYLCGPPPMIDAANAWLENIGIDLNFVYSEKFLPS